MIQVLFVCLGNICRSPIGEFILKDLVKKQNLENHFYIASRGTSSEELGNPIYYLAKEKLEEHNISCENKVAQKLTKEDLDKYDYILAMDNSNIRAIERIGNQEEMRNVYRLLDFTNEKRDIEDPWYTRDFDKAYQDIVLGCEGFLDFCKEKGL